MKNRKYLFIYHNGARGDFLSSILLGDVLKSNTAGAWVLRTGVGHSFCHKIHDIDMLEYNQGLGLPTKINSFDDYDIVIRIKFESTVDCEQALKLATVKLADKNFTSNVAAYQLYEENFSKMDHKFSKVIPFQDLFDIDKLKSLFLKFRGREMSSEEEERVVDNIKINLAVLGKN